MRTQHPSRHLAVVPPPSDEQDADEQLTDDTDRLEVLLRRLGRAVPRIAEPEIRGSVLENLERILVTAEGWPGARRRDLFDISRGDHS